MSLSSKGKRSAMEPATSSEESPVMTDAEMQVMMRMIMQKEEEGPSRAKPLSLSFTELLALEGNSCSGLDKIGEESDGEKSGVSISMKSGKRGSSQLPNLDLSLLPSRESFELLRTPQRSAIQPNQWPPFSGFRSPFYGGFSPLNVNAFSNQQQQLTIFYGGTVNVYEVSADMAKEIMVLASSGVNTKATSTAATPTSFAPSTPACSSSIAAEIMCSTPLPMGRPVQIQPTFSLKAANLPISRKNSLQRFLEKRNDRLHARAPYAPLRQN